MKLLILAYGILLHLSSAFAFSTISEGALMAFMRSPLDVLPSAASPAASTAKVNLLKWNVSPQDPPMPTERYNRLNHFGEWITLTQKPEDCIDTRNLVLQRDSQSAIEMRPGNNCRVGKGTWHDPYTNTTLNDSRDVQIDHMVPLKDSYINGAWKWNYQTRCTYANFMGFRDHLKPVTGRENMLKSDNSPAGYMPPNAAYKCEYIRNWLSIKLIWKLGMQRDEAQKIKDLVKELKCDTSQFTFSTAELQKQRQLIQQSMGSCATTPQPSKYALDPQP